MIKKLQSYLRTVLIVFWIIVLIFFIGLWIYNAFKKVEALDTSKLDEYMTEQNLVTAYNVFGLLENCTNSFYEALLSEQYDELYKATGEATKDNLSKSEIIQKYKKYGKEILGTDNVLDGHKINLKKAYKTDYGYIAEITSTFSDKILCVIFKFDAYQTEYTIDLLI